MNFLKVDGRSILSSLGSKKFYLFIGFVVLATVTSAYYSLDSSAYQDIFRIYSNTSWDNLTEEIFSYELFYIVLAKIYAGFPSLVWFGTIGLLSVGLKLLLIEKASRHFYWSLAVYIGCFFVLFDGTVIRASLAIIIAYWGAWFFSQSRYLIALVLVGVAATCFHYSLAFFLVVFFFRSKAISWILIIAYPLLVGLWFLGYDLLHVSLDVVRSLDSTLLGLNKLRSYLLRIDPYGVPYTLHFIALYFGTILVFWRYRNELTVFELICFNCVFMCLVIVALFVGSITAQSRVSDIFRFGLVFIMPLYYRYALEWLKRPNIVTIAILCVLMAYFYKYTVVPGIIQWP